jgi:general secretion pathway protein J
MAIVQARPAAGFTMVEILAAMVLLAVLLATAYGTLGGATRAAAGGEALIEETNRIRVTQELLRMQWSRALPLAFEFDESEGLPRLFEGDAEHVRFVAQMPGHLGEGGPQVQLVELTRGRDGLDLVFKHLPLHPIDEGQLADDVEGVVLLRGLRSGAFRFRGYDEEGELGEWLDAWDTPHLPPLMVELDLELAEDSRVSWPLLQVALLVDSVPGGAFLAAPSGGPDFGPRPGEGRPRPVEPEVDPDDG